MVDKAKLLNSEPLSREKFQNPSREFGIMPFWFWNGEMNRDEMEYQLREYYAKGMPGLFIHARFGIREHMAYLGEDWFDRVRFTLEKAQEIGLQVWVYDEYNWPSGTAGQTVQAIDPGLTQVYLQLVEGDLPGQFFSFMEGTDSRYNDLEESEPVYACAVKLEDLRAGRFEYVDLTPSLSFDKVLTWEAPKGPWKQMYFIERKAGWYTDVLNPETTKRFLEYTHERYKAAQGGRFAQDHGVLGFYTDEPAMLYFEAGRDNYVLPWSKKMFRIFRERNGYDLRRNLPKLFYDLGGDYDRVRHDFWNALSDQYDEAYYKRIAGWCESNGVVFTGHLLHEESLRMHLKSGGNLFKHLSHLGLTGVDHLYPRVGTREMPNEHVALKIASSAAHHFGSARLLCESMGGSYWDCTMERMKWIADWEYVLGVNIFNPHGYHYSIEGERKRDWPPSQFYHHTWWEYYGLFNAYLSRAGYVLTGGRHVAKIAVLYPIHSMWANFTPQKKDKISSLIEEDFVYMTDRLLRLHADFDYMDEDVLAGCEIRDGKLLIRDEAYELLLLPPCTHIKGSTADMLEKFVSSGGKVIGGALLPYRLADGGGEDLPRRMEAVFGRNPLEMRERFLSGTAKGIAETDGMARLKKLIFEQVTPDVEIDSEEVFCLHRIKDGQNFYFFVNPTQETLAVNVSIEGEYAPELWNLEDGKTAPLLPYRAESGRTFFPLKLYPFGSALAAAGNSPDGRSGVPAPEETLFARMDIGAGKLGFSMTKPNTLVRGRWKLEAPGLEAQPEVGMGAWEMQLPTEWEGGYPVDLTFTATVLAGYVAEDLRLMIDGFKGSGWELSVNGRQVKETPERSYLDAEIKTVPLKDYFKIGENLISLKLAVCKKSDGLVDPLKIIGSFAVESAGGGTDRMVPPPAAIELGDWVNQGLPFYSGSGVYTVSVDIPSDWDNKKVYLTADVGGDVLECYVNGTSAGVRPWQPYRLDLTGLLASGSNKLDLKVTNTLINMLEGVRKRSGLFSAALEAYETEAVAW
ncbi:MAG: hypothetical protein LBS62_08520 [Clostridiales bacterium]|jgi:hypothetical protein|nr:hypothetical protein [Clostridiales bacterium]